MRVLYALKREALLLASDCRAYTIREGEVKKRGTNSTVPASFMHRKIVLLRITYVEITRLLTTKAY